MKINTHQLYIDARQSYKIYKKIVDDSIEYTKSYAGEYFAAEGRYKLEQMFDINYLRREMIDKYLDCRAARSTTKRALLF